MLAPSTSGRRSLAGMLTSRGRLNGQQNEKGRPTNYEQQSWEWTVSSELDLGPIPSSAQRCVCQVE